MNTPGIDVTIVRTTNRSSKAVLNDEGILIRLAGRLSEREEKRHIDILLRRMVRAHAKQKHRVKIDPFRPLLNGEKSLKVELVTGQNVYFHIKDGTKMRATEAMDGWFIEKSSKTDEKTFHKFLWRLLGDSIQKEATAYVNSVNQETLRESVRSVSVKLMKSRWGSCGRRGQIALSTPLFLTSKEVLRYVVIHELAHITHPNHSKAFWNTVEVHCPEYREATKAIRGFTIPKA